MVEKKNLLLGISGSPRKQGTEFAVQYALNYAADNVFLQRCKCPKWCHVQLHGQGIYRTG